MSGAYLPAGMPVPLPQALRRADGPWQSTPLVGRVASVGAGPDPSLLAQDSIHSFRLSLRNWKNSPDRSFQSSNCSLFHDIKVHPL